MQYLSIRVYSARKSKEYGQNEDDPEQIFILADWKDSWNNFKEYKRQK